MRFVLFVLSVIAATTVLDTPTKAQNYPWCAIYSGGRGGGGTNCGFTTLNNAWQPRAGLVASANPIRNTCLHPDHIGTLGIGAIHIEGLTLTMLGKQTIQGRPTGPTASCVLLPRSHSVRGDTLWQRALHALRDCSNTRCGVFPL